MKPNLYLKHTYHKVDIAKVEFPIETHRLSIKLLALNEQQVDRVIAFLKQICDEGSNDLVQE